MKTATILQKCYPPVPNITKPLSTRYAPNLRNIQGTLKYGRKQSNPSTIEMEKVNSSSMPDALSEYRCGESTPEFCI